MYLRRGEIAVKEGHSTSPTLFPPRRNEPQAASPAGDFSAQFFTVMEPREANASWPCNQRAPHTRSVYTAQISISARRPSPATSNCASCARPGTKKGTLIPPTPHNADRIRSPAHRPAEDLVSGLQSLPRGRRSTQSATSAQNGDSLPRALPPNSLSARLQVPKKHMDAGTQKR
ncbi:hypothetical protein B0H19DRAFT_1264574 [Mycena capillaripes]|nr:hypothetical protein B0H19DRAFT_1264574 [Mycena capillaripes]